MSKNQWDKAFERMQSEAEQESKEHKQRWDKTLERLANEWNETAREIQRS